MRGLNRNATRFIEGLHIAGDLGFDKPAVLTHAWHECRHPRTLEPFGAVIGENNFWGIKTPERSNWYGKVAEVWTHEDEPALPGETENGALFRVIKKYGRTNAVIEATETKNGTAYWRVGLPQTFRDWDTAQEAMSWYCGHVEKLFPAAFAGRADALRFFRGLVSGKYRWATDPAYVEKLGALYVELLTDKTIISELA